MPLLEAAGVKPDDGIVPLDHAGGTRFADRAAAGRVWKREAKVRGIF